ncbi:MAG: ASKHA domain-containing protein [Candidatus Bipolaricaulota bacterium]
MGRVTFQPTGEAVEAKRGETLLALARDAGILIASTCGGDGICGRCRLIVQRGRVRAPPTVLLTREEIQAGYVLACQAEPVGDVDVLVPPEARAEGAVAPVDQAVQRFRALHAAVEGGPSFHHDPLVRKVYLELPPPTLQDNLADQERLYRELRRRQASILQMGLKVLQPLPRLLRRSGWKATFTVGQRGGTTEVIQVEPGDRTEHNFGVAVDVGTSTVAVHLVDLVTSQTVDAEACYNSQAAFGAEVTRRILYVDREGPEALREAIVEDINGLVAALVSRNGVELRDVTAVFCAGNTAMTHFLLGLDPSHVRKSPYVPAATGPSPVRAAEVGIKINPRGLLYAMPGIGGWVGGDITAGILATGLHRADRLTMLIDVGTNGEIVLGNKDWMIACSTSAGPAFEGSGVRCGMRAGQGAIERVEITPDGHVRFRTIGEASPKGVCGSGLVDAVAELYRAGWVDRSGQLLPGASPLIRDQDGLAEFVLVPASRTAIGKDIVITQGDIENLLRAKAAIYAGVKILVASMGLRLRDVELLLVAGGFGNYLDREKAVLLGLIPDLPLDRIRFVGNTSILGAKLALGSTDALDEGHEIARRVTYFDLIVYPHYYEEFMSAKFIPHTDLGQFPSVRRALKGASA